jgi:transcriptional regulator with XRE-family HTH domain
VDDIILQKKIAEFRKSRGLTISELANLVNLTPSMLSQIERGTANPSINTLKLIAKSLDIPVYRFFVDEDHEEKNILRAKDRKRVQFTENNGFAYEMLTPDVPSNIEFIQMEIHPDASSSDTPMAHQGEEVAVVTQGTVNIILETKEYILKKGDSIRIGPQIPHRWFNPYKDITRIIFAVTPPLF